MNEAETRAERIDPALSATGWGFVDGSKILREHPITSGRIEIAPWHGFKLFCAAKR
jgi:type I restriction enzyme R subunit